MTRIVFILLLYVITSSAQFAPVIRGDVVNNILNEPIAFATVIVPNSHPQWSATIDGLGNFILGSMSIGRYDLQVRINHQEGDRHLPIDNAQSLSNQTAIYDESNAFSLQYLSAFTSHLKASYQMNKKKAIHQIALSIINLTQYEEYAGFHYNYQSKKLTYIANPSSFLIEQQHRFLTPFI